IETKIDAEQRVGLSDGYRVLGKLVFEPAGCAPFANKVADEGDTQPNRAAKQRAEALEHRELNGLGIDADRVATSQAVSDQQVEPRHHNEPNPARLPDPVRGLKVGGLDVPKPSCPEQDPTNSKANPAE